MACRVTLVVDFHHEICPAHERLRLYDFIYYVAVNLPNLKLPNNVYQTLHGAISNLLPYTVQYTTSYMYMYLFSVEYFVTSYNYVAP